MLETPPKEYAPYAEFGLPRADLGALVRSSIAGIRRQWLIVALSVVIFAGLAVAYVLTATPQFTAPASIISTTPGVVLASANARCRCSWASLECRAWNFAVRCDFRISIKMNVATAISMNPAKKKRKMLSTVSTADASTIRKARIARVT